MRAIRALDVRALDVPNGASFWASTSTDGSRAARLTVRMEAMSASSAGGIPFRLFEAGSNFPARIAEVRPTNDSDSNGLTPVTAS